VFVEENLACLKKRAGFPYHELGVKRLSALVWLSTLLGAAPSACVYDGDHRCGPHQQLISNDRCACEAGYVPGTEGCIPCGDNERESNGECVCVSGYARAAVGAACEAVPAELGAACDTTSAPCSLGKYPLCHVTSGTSGYCTNGCSSASVCDGGYKCHQDGADSYCRRPPLGYGNSCKTDADCSAGEATFCEKIQSNLCLVPCSAGHSDVCFEGEVCCNFVLFNPICVPSDSCTSMSGTEVK
jgi:hypothetical protein